MPTRALERLAHAAAWRSARLVLVGDRAQLPAIDAGGGFAALGRSPRRGGADREPPPADRAAARCRTASGRGPRGRGASRFSPRTGASSPSTMRATRASALVTAWARAELDSPGRNLMLAHDRHDVAELNRIAREWREQWGFISDRRITASRHRVGDRRSDGVPQKRLLPRGAQRHPGDGGRPRPPRRAPGSVHRPRRDDPHPRRLPGPRPPRLRPHRACLPGRVGRSHLRPREPRARRGRVGVRRRITPAPSTFRCSSSTTRPRTSRRPSPVPGRARRPSRSRSTSWIRRTGSRRWMPCAATSTRATPERLIARVEELRAARESARQEAARCQPRTGARRRAAGGRGARRGGREGGRGAR